MRFRDLVQPCLARAVDAESTHGAVGVGIAVAAGRKVAAGAVHAEAAVAVKVSGAVAAGGEGAAHAVDAVTLVVAVGGAEAVAALIPFRRKRACELVKELLQSNPLNGSPDNGSIGLLVQVLASPISLLSK